MSEQIDASGVFAEVEAEIGSLEHEPVPTSAPAHNPLVPASVRDWLYPISLAVIALLGSYGVVESNQIALWGSLAASILGVGTATAYRPSKSPETTP